MPACVGNRQTSLVRVINLKSLVTAGGKPTDTDVRNCPKCRQATFEYTPHVAVLVRSISKRSRKAADQSKDRLRYERAWLCKNAACKYLRLVTANSRKRKP